MDGRTVLSHKRYLATVAIGVRFRGAFGCCIKRTVYETVLSERLEALRMKAALYCRVSLDDGRQTVENQRQQLAEFCGRMGWQVVAEFHDAKSGKSLDRPGLKKMMEAASRREFDVLCFWDLSRLSRSGVVDVLGVLQQLAGWGVAYRSLQESYLDSLGPFSDVVVSLLASIAKLEREKIRERTLAGLARARKQGRIGGRPKAGDDHRLVASVQRLREAGLSVRAIAAETGKSTNTVLKLLRADEEAA
jgi:DNA invertase Pin-like site-specific DNA recombinase